MQAVADPSTGDHREADMTAKSIACHDTARHHRQKQGRP